MGEPCVVDRGRDAEGDSAAEDVEVFGFSHCVCLNSIDDLFMDYPELLVIE